MSARLLEGKPVAAAIRAEIAQRVRERLDAGRRPPGLGVVLVGDNAASASYVRAKTAACSEAGFHSVQVNLPADATEGVVLERIRAFNADPAIHGILVQLPLPPHIDEGRVLMAVSPDKDVDGFHPVNAGLLALGRPRFVSCTPLGIRELLLRSGIDTAGMFAVVVGRSTIVGRPMASLLLQRAAGGDATVCVCHSQTQGLPEIVRRADLLIAAMGRPRFIRGGWIKPGAVVVDVGINRLEDAESKSGYRIVGDVCFEEAVEVASAITPVPGGIGPMTIAMLLRNTLEAAERG